MKSHAILSDDEVYRYLLVRHWERYPKWVNFVMLNPSTADATRDDSTVRKCKGFARRWGYTGFFVTNLFAYRARSPVDLRTASKRIGSENNHYLRWAADRSHMIVVAWGNQGRHYPKRVKNTLKLLGYPFLRPNLYCIGRTLHGHPSHPLMLSYETPLERF